MHPTHWLISTQALGEGSVGYSVRLDRRTSAATRLEFVTVGVLLRRLQRPDGLADVTHVVVDEAHERDARTGACIKVSRRRTSACRRAAREM